LYFRATSVFYKSVKNPPHKNTNPTFPKVNLSDSNSQSNSSTLIFKIINSLKIKGLERHFNGKYLIAVHDQKHSKIETGVAYHENLKRLMEM
jgi:hypothetical protein